MSGPVDVDGDAAQGQPSMTPGVDGDGAPSDAPIDRSAALAEGAPRVPANFIWWLLGAVLVLSLGGLIGEHLFSAAGLNPTSTTTTTTTPSATRVPPAEHARPTAPEPDARRGAAVVHGPQHPEPAARPRLHPQRPERPGGHGAGSPLAVVVLTFFDARCNDICPVLAAEIEQADTDLGTQASDVEFVTVNTDPAALAASSSAPAGATGLATLPNWHFVTGPLSSLNTVWKAYGVSISVNTKTGLEAHSDVMDFIDNGGFLRYRATPFADEGSNGAYTLSPASETRWAQGIAAYAERLIKQ